MPDLKLDLSRSPIKIPERFRKVLYDPKRYPGASGVQGVEGGQTASNTPTNLYVHLALRFLTSDPAISGRTPPIPAFPSDPNRST